MAPMKPINEEQHSHLYPTREKLQRPPPSTEQLRKGRRGWSDCSPPNKADWVQSPARATPGFSQAGIASHDAAGRRVFSEIYHFPRPFIPALLHTIGYSRHSNLSAQLEPGSPRRSRHVIRYPSSPQATHLADLRRASRGARAVRRPLTVDTPAARVRNPASTDLSRGALFRAGGTCGPGAHFRVGSFGALSSPPPRLHECTLARPLPARHWRHSFLETRQGSPELAPLFVNPRQSKWRAAAKILCGLITVRHPRAKWNGKWSWPAPNDLQARLYSLMYEYADINCTSVVCCHSGRRQLDTVIQELATQRVAEEELRDHLDLLKLEYELLERQHLQFSSQGRDQPLERKWKRKTRVKLKSVGERKWLKYDKGKVRRKWKSKQMAKVQEVTKRKMLLVLDEESNFMGEPLWQRCSAGIRANYVLLGDLISESPVWLGTFLELHKAHGLPLGGISRSAHPDNPQSFPRRPLEQKLPVARILAPHISDTPR
ncbi:hypothetical protein PR048_014005 [Dryococelus australis]|uniref:Uncharacterized protein n=1 Tax=Dryococelus australis TaxID=614101 RepID=A0ABQ9HTT7_9NEOP|nr:hypothetical protein PR048_014005 [Dryococelus australis]